MEVCFARACLACRGRSRAFFLEIAALGSRNRQANDKNRPNDRPRVREVSPAMTMSSEPNRPIPVSKRGLRKAILAEILALDPKSRERGGIGSGPAVSPGAGMGGRSNGDALRLGLSRGIEDRRVLGSSIRGEEAGDLSARRSRGQAVEVAPGPGPPERAQPWSSRDPEPRADLPEIPPESIDWVLVPGLAFDERGYRLGRGAGHYDRLLPQLRPDAACWALCLSCQLIPSLPIEPHDMPLDGVCTRDRLILGVRASEKDLGFTSCPRPF